ncbi:MAG: hypothetical protein VX294_13000 [Candidatus Latescibacterota bacterium]|nr:hypothetical protein [Candidatus Latescibacterota bacterium]
MKIWMDVMRDLEHLIENYEVIFDGWQAGGVEGLVIGPLVFNSAKLLPGTVYVPMKEAPAFTYDPNPDVYKNLGVEAPPAPDSHPEKRGQLFKTLTNAKERGMEVWIFQAQHGAGPGGDGHVFGDERSLAATSARMIDTLEQYPMVDGAIMDGPEWGYEIDPHHMNFRSYIFNDLPDSLRSTAEEMDYDFDAMVAAKDRLYKQMHNLNTSNIRLHGGGGLLGGFHLFGSDPDLFSWMSFRVEALTNYFANIKKNLDAHASHSVGLGVGPRSAAFAPLCGYDFSALAGVVDILLPKHYFWHRGFDGMVGTVCRYVQTLCEWNPNLNDADALQVVEALFGIVLPNVSECSDFERALTPEFFELVVYDETARALAVVDNPERVVPWVDAGRWPHDGDPMPAIDLERLIESAAEAGLERFLYHHHGNLTAGEWSVMSERCGRPWVGSSGQYSPPDEAVL